MQHSTEPSEEAEAVKNPCVRNCCLDEQDVCMGCGRTLQEITGWSKLNQAERKAVLKVAERRKKQRSFW